MAGAVLAAPELELQARITGEDVRVHVVNPLDPPDPLLAVLLRGMPGTGLRTDALVQRGVLRRETRRFLGLLRHQVRTGGTAAPPTGALGDPHAEVRKAAVLALLHHTAARDTPGKPGALADPGADVRAYAARGRWSTTRGSCTRAGGLAPVVGGYAGRTRETPSYGSTDEHRTRGTRAAMGGSARGRLDRR
ncbi:hypothetical protein [Streptomyces clavifer]|uniref:hypothetical protein n=1 Tax=Streptomyces clavifer TaxID=68188 RepID=UPI003D9F66AB